MQVDHAPWAGGAGTREALTTSLTSLGERALALELLSLGLAIATQVAPPRGPSRTRAVPVPTTLALLLPAAAILGDTSLRRVSEHTLAAVLAFGCAALLYLVTEELLVEAHEVSETTFSTGMFFAAFLLFLVLGMVG